MSPLIVLLGAAAAALLSWASVLGLRRWAPRLALIDIPNERSSHLQPTPRGGGLAFVVVAELLTGIASRLWPTLLPAGSSALMTASLIVAIIGLLDDRWGLSAALRLVVQLGAAVYFVSQGIVLTSIWLPGGTSLPLGWMAAPLTVFWLVAVTNAYNFMDGIDGLVAGHTVVVGLVLSAVCYAAGALGLALALALMAGAVFGFLLHNWPPARIFMGDVGSGYLGFVFAGWAVIAAGPGSTRVPFVAWLVVSAPLLFDAAFTLVSRTLRGDRIYQPHREHLYQRLIRLGWTHLRVTGLYLITTAIASFLTLTHYALGMIQPAHFLLLCVLLLTVIPATVWRAELRSDRRR